MAYATVDELAFALHTRVTTENTSTLQACLDAAAIEIDHYVDALDGDPPLDGDPLAGRVNVLRGVEWWKSNDAAFGVVGTAETGQLTAPRDSFARHGRELVPLKRQWGVA